MHGDKAGLHDQSRRRPTLTRAILSLPSARQRFTAGFGTGPGGTTGLRSPGFRAEAPVFWGGGVRSACPGVSRGGMMGIDLLLFWTRRQGKGKRGGSRARSLTSAWRGVSAVMGLTFHSFIPCKASSQYLHMRIAPFPKREESSLSEFSIARLNTLLRFHLRPINVVVFHVPMGKIHLGRDLALRCFQRLFLPHLATRPCI